MLRGFIKDSHTRESDSEFCAQKREKIAMVEFQFIGQDYTIISRNVRTTFISALANLGKDLSLQIHAQSACKI